MKSLGTLLVFLFLCAICWPAVAQHGQLFFEIWILKETEPGRALPSGQVGLSTVTQEFKGVAKGNYTALLHLALNYFLCLLLGRIPFSRGQAHYPFSRHS